MSQLGQKTNFGLCRLPTTSTPRADIQEQTFSDAARPIAIPLQTITHTVGRVGINYGGRSSSSTDCGEDFQCKSPGIVRGFFLSKLMPHVVNCCGVTVSERR